MILNGLVTWSKGMLPTANDMLVQGPHVLCLVSLTWVNVLIYVSWIVDHSTVPEGTINVHKNNGAIRHAA
jgi:hypothetical protein